MNRVLGAFVSAFLLNTIATTGAPAEEAKSESISELVKRIRPSVVTVYNATRGGEQNGIGSGFFVGESGLVATNLHVIGEGRPIRLKLSDGSEPKVTAIHAWDRKRDLAILRVEGADASSLELATNEETFQGAEALALGNPQGLEFSVTTGVISAVREVDGIEMIQVAVPIERGNSGGPLINRDGKVLGVLTLKSAVTENLGFAMPAEAVESLLEQPNTVSIENWLRFGALNLEAWEPLGADWQQRTGVITVIGAGDRFGGPVLCLSKLEVPELPYEVSLDVKLDDESGAGGIAFGSDGRDRHYGFYPTNGQLRLTRFDGPTFYTWNILKQVVSPHYKEGEFNRLRVRVEKERILCYLNGELVIESDDKAWRSGRSGICKYRQTEPEYRRFALGKNLALNGAAPESVRESIGSFVSDASKNPEISAELLEHANALRHSLFDKAAELEAKAVILRRMAGRVHETRVQRAMKETLSAPEDDIDLLRAALLVSYLDNPDLILDDYLSEVDRMATELKERFMAAAAKAEKDALSERQKLELLGAYLFEVNGYHGSRADYYNPSNSYLNQVIDFREGIPITLSVIYMELARRVGLKVVGIPLPGHFVVRHEPARKGVLPQLVDAFDGGKFISEQEAAAIVGSITGGGLAPEHLQPASKADIIDRMLRNLHGIALASADQANALPYSGLILSIRPDEPRDRLGRAILLFQAGRLPEAKEDIDWLLERQPPGIDLQRLEEWRSSIETE
jgi:serine protease Do